MLININTTTTPIMALPIRTRTIPQCSACLRNYAWTETTSTSLSHQQLRGAKKLASRNDTASIPVRLRKDLPGYGKVGAYIPISSGEMRNKFFPRRLADYTTLQERQALRTRNIPVERDYEFKGYTVPVLKKPTSKSIFGIDSPAVARSAPRPVAPEKLSPERSIELLDIFVRPRLDFYRQPLPTEVEPETPTESQPEQGHSAAADLLAVRASSAKPKLASQGIYGSVTPLDVLVAVRAAIATNDEAARIVLTENDVEFVDLKEEDVGRGVKHTGDFTVAIRVRGTEGGGSIKRTVRVIPQEAV
ncbi:Ribosomal protein L9/RNase H1 [Zymoseptoria brevis]|uniref:Ribosomal protein L9/RNase H1 n=1 Tax=Zymoseptoria brevis TaxID=1047168 RepID=A0A0F4G8C5_9PEZI|nr:Ribosomal protein L9/RNase H1 [Zymoseptoria brevis]